MKVLTPLFLAISAFAQPVTVVCNLPCKISGPSGSEAARGDLLVQSTQTFTATDGKVIDATTVSVFPFSQGQFAVKLEPTPVGVYYTVKYGISGSSAPKIEKWSVRTSGSPLNLADVQMGTFVIPWMNRGAWSPLTTYYPDDLVLSNGSTYRAITQSLNADPQTISTSWTLLAQAATNGLNTFSIVLMSPISQDSGLLQKTENLADYYIKAVSCSADTLGTVTINLEVRTAAAPNNSGTPILGTALNCGPITTTVTVSPPVLVPAGAPLALVIPAISGNPQVVRVHVSR